MILQPVRRRTWIPFLIGFVVLWGTLAGLGELPLLSGLWPVVILAVLAGLKMLVERLLFHTPWRDAAAGLGFGRSDWRVILLAIVVSGLVLLVFPIAQAVTGTTFDLRADWVWLLVGIFAYNGLVEELVWRGYVFRRLRVGRTFSRAVLWTMPLIAATHIPIIVTAGPIVGIGAMLVAAVTSIAFGYLYENGRNTIWAPAILHTAIDSFKLFVVPADATLTFSLLLIVVSLTVPLLVLVVRRRHLVPAANA